MTGELPSFEKHDEIEMAYERRLSIGANHLLPGRTWAEGNMFTLGLALPNCNMDEAIYDDPVWAAGAGSGRLSIASHENPVLAPIFYSGAVRRLQAVEQLTLPPRYSTVPNTGALSRFEHIWGSVLFVRKLSERHNIPPEQRKTFEQRTLVSDIGHTYGSHLGDWLFQGIGEHENQHDIELMSYLEATGINDILRRYEINPETVVFPEVQDWVEADQPDLCVDRVDYGLREMNRWNQYVRAAVFGIEDFTITPEGMLAMTDQRRARIFSEGFLLLSEENWSEPTHRAVLDLYMLRTRLFYAQGHSPRTWLFKPPEQEIGLVALHEIHPRDLMYVTDSAQQLAFAYPDLVGNTLEAMMTEIARYHRQYVWPARNNRINSYMSQFDEGTYQQHLAKNSFLPYGSTAFDTFRDEYPQTMPLGFSIHQTGFQSLPSNELSIDIPQPPFKVRQIDPLVKHGDTFGRLSELDSSYGKRMEDHRKTVTQMRTARFTIPDARSRTMLQTMIAGVDQQWHARLQNSRRLSQAELRELVATTAREIHGEYPFMTFLEY